ncbi:MAG: hypothetical protein LBU27_04905 [Candidatus Peribacteria bacterium]|nr:hypothetical protein [Candidatus Peribacteria bacterium]
MKRMPVLEILLVLSAVYLFTNKHIDIYIPFILLGLGVTIYLVKVLKVKSLEKDERSGEQQNSSVAANPQPMPKLSKNEKQELIERVLQKMRTLTDSTILLLDDIRKEAKGALTETEIESIARQIQNPKVYCNIWETEEKLKTLQFYDTYLGYLIEFGSEICRDYCVAMYRKQNISYLFFDALLRVCPNLLYRMTKLSSTQISSLIRFQSAAELVQGNILSLIEICQPKDAYLRKEVFEKIVKVHDVDLTNAIQSTQILSLEEARQIAKRGKSSEMDALLDRNDAHQFLGLFPLTKALTVMLGLEGNSVLRDEISTKYPFTQKTFEDYKVALEKLNNDDLFGTDEAYDMILFIEDKLQNHPQQADLRKQVFQRILEASKYLSELIPQWRTLTEEEITAILEREEDEELEALYARTDVDISKYLPLKMAVEIMLELQHADFLDTVEEKFDFSKWSLEEYKAVIDNLDEDELFANGDVEYHFISLVEEKLSQHPDREEIRAYAFEKMKDSQYLSSGIPRWKNLTKNEVASILKKNDEDELTALSERSDIGDLSQYFTLKVAVKVWLGLFLPESRERVDTDFGFTQKTEEEYKEIIDDLDGDELCGYDSYEDNEPEYDFIEFIEKKLSQHPQKDSLRETAFEKMQNSEYLEYAIARWEALGPKEADSLFDADIENEFQAIMERDDVNTLLSQISDEVFFSIYTEEYAFDFSDYEKLLNVECKRRKRESSEFKQRIKEYEAENE